MPENAHNDVLLDTPEVFFSFLKKLKFKKFWQKNFFLEAISPKNPGKSKKIEKIF